MNNSEHNEVVEWINCYHAENYKYPTHEQILVFALTGQQLTIGGEV